VIAARSMAAPAFFPVNAFSAVFVNTLAKRIIVRNGIDYIMSIYALIPRRFIDTPLKKTRPQLKAFFIYNYSGSAVQWLKENENRAFRVCVLRHGNWRTVEP
jgi:hypothetical protein